MTRAIGKHLRDRGAAASVTPEFIPKWSSALIGNGGRATEEAARLEIGEGEEVH